MSPETSAFKLQMPGKFPEEYYILNTAKVSKLLNVDGWVILKLILQKWSGRIRIGFISFRTG